MDGKEVFSIREGNSENDKHRRRGMSKENRIRRMAERSRIKIKKSFFKRIRISSEK